MISAGIDIGSRTIKLVTIKENEIVTSEVRPNSYNTIEICREMLTGVAYDSITSTGYGRHLFSRHFECDVISEIKAFTLGAYHMVPDCKTILDIGGQDTKAIAVDNDGKISKFEMNDKCAAGTGKFLEIMSNALEFTMEEFISAASGAEHAEKINSMCTVFAESEVISLIGRGALRDEVSLGIHNAIVKRSVSMLKRVSIRDNVVFVGGVANNACVRKLIEKEIGTTLFVPENPQTIGALGCALHQMKAGIPN
ncbi:MAG TPA: acyl-CoA dehydratase activase [Spirochaetota bacterium]|nr:acyl-CoA dehydratase activase [Spirochaetota bacterium]HPJ39575.1 acyl-CoA dehydratase activase [Spirochaetota bacterium]